MDNLIISADNKSPIQAIFLDLSSVFDTLDYDILLTRLEQIGITGTVLKWISNFIRDRYFSVKIHEQFSSPRKLYYGVPRGYNLSSIIFAIYLLPLSSILNTFPNVTTQSTPTKLNYTPKSQTLVNYNSAWILYTTG